LKRKTSEMSRQSLEKTIDDKIIKGALQALKCPPSHIVECSVNSERLPEEDEKAMGYAFSWGQLLEMERDEMVTWEIRFEKLHRDFLDVNKSSRELSDRFLDSIGCLDAPDYLLFKKGTLRSSSASIILTDPKKETLARKYLVSVCARGNGSPMISLVRSIRRLIKSNNNNS